MAGNWTFDQAVAYVMWDDRSKVHASAQGLLVASIWYPGDHRPVFKMDERHLMQALLKGRILATGCPDGRGRQVIPAHVWANAIARKKYKGSGVFETLIITSNEDERRSWRDVGMDPAKVIEAFEEAPDINTPLKKRDGQRAVYDATAEYLNRHGPAPRHGLLNDVVRMLHMQAPFSHYTLEALRKYAAPAVRIYLQNANNYYND